MASKSKKILASDELLWDYESPVVIEKISLEKDRVLDDNALFITFRNISGYSLYELTISIAFRDATGKRVAESMEYTYYGIEVPLGQTFGDKIPIHVCNLATDFKITFQRADYEDGQYFRGELPFKPLPEPLPLSTLQDYEEDFVNYLHKFHPDVPVNCAPEKRKQYWRCTCGRMYPHIMRYCPICGMEYEPLFQIIPELKRERRERAKELARAEKLRLEE